MKVASLASSSLKHVPAPAAAGAVTASEPNAILDPVILIAILIGLVAGAMWRAGYLRETQKAGWGIVSGDLINSGLAGFANAIAALFVTHWLEGGVLIALGVAMLIAATGVRALLWAQRAADEYLRSKFGGSGAGKP